MNIFKFAGVVVLIALTGLAISHIINVEQPKNDFVIKKVEQIQSETK